MKASGIDGRAVLAAFGAGVVVAHYGDRDSGKRRRARAMDRLARTQRKWNAGLAKVSRDLPNRLQGLGAALRSTVRRDQPIDTVLEQRIRSALGRTISHTGALTLTVENGEVWISGPILEKHSQKAVACIRRVPGVRDVHNNLTVYASPEGVPALQGLPRLRADEFEFLQEHWSPTARAVALAAGSGLVFLRASSARTGLARLGLPVGLAVVTRAVTNTAISRLLGLAGPGVSIQKDINIPAPAERVYQRWADCRTFSESMSHLKDSKQVDEKTCHLVFDGPAGTTLRWNAEITKSIPDQLIAWRTRPGSMVAHAGTVRFDPSHNGGTRIGVKMHYRPPMGAIGHLVASFFGKDPKQVLDDDLVRLKTQYENGGPPIDAESTRSKLPVKAASGQQRAEEPPSARLRSPVMPPNPVHEGSRQAPPG